MWPAATLKPGGLPVLDESRLPGTPGDEAPEIRYNNYEYLHEADWDALFAKTGLVKLEKRQAEEDEMADKNNEDLAAIARRAEELSARYPEKRALFAGYLQSQQNEVEDLETALDGAVWLLQKM